MGVVVLGNDLQFLLLPDFSVNILSIAIKIGKIYVIDSKIKSQGADWRKSIIKACRMSAIVINKREFRFCNMSKNLNNMT
jgi:hypothetical protein